MEKRSAGQIEHTLVGRKPDPSPLNSGDRAATHRGRASNVRPHKTHTEANISMCRGIHCSMVTCNATSLPPRNVSRASLDSCTHRSVKFSFRSWVALNRCFADADDLPMSAMEVSHQWLPGKQHETSL